MRNKTSVMLAAVAVLATVAALWLTSRAVTPKTATWEDVVAEAEAGGYRLINTEELAGLYGRDAAGLLLVDTRQDWEYRAGHIAGAVNFPMEPTAWSRWQKKGEIAEMLGPDKARTLVFY